MNKNNTLIRTDDEVLSAACELISAGPFLPQVLPGSVVRIKRVTAFKTTISWFAASGDGPSIHEQFQSEDRHEYYVVDHAWSRWTRWFRKLRLGDRFYLRPLHAKDKLDRPLKLLKTRDVLM